MITYSGCIIWESASLSAEGYFKTVSHQGEAEVGINCRFTVVGGQPMLLWLYYLHPVEVSIKQSNAFKIKLHLRSQIGNVCLFLDYRKHIYAAYQGGFVCLFLMERNKRETTTECGHQGATPTSGEEDVRSRGHFIQGEMCRISSQRNVVQINKPSRRRGAVSVHASVPNRIDTLHV